MIYFPQNEKIIKIKIFSTFIKSDKASITYSNVFNIPNGIYKNKFQFVSDESYTHAIIQNTAMPNLKNIPKENVLGVAFEPIELLKINQIFLNYAEKYIGTYLIGKNTGLPKNFINHYSYMWHTQNKKDYINPHNKFMSIIFSNKKSLPGHKLRHQLVNKILDSNLPIDIYGKGCITLKRKDPRIKGEFSGVEPFDGYQFSIAIENTESIAYVSEKFVDCICMNVIPIYFGAKNVTDFFGNYKCCHSLSGNSCKDFEFIKNICQNKQDYILNLDKARKSIFSEKAYFPEYIVNKWC